MKKRKIYSWRGADLNDYQKQMELYIEDFIEDFRSDLLEELRTHYPNYQLVTIEKRIEKKELCIAICVKRNNSKTYINLFVPFLSFTDYNEPLNFLTVFGEVSTTNESLSFRGKTSKKVSFSGFFNLLRLVINKIEEKYVNDI